MSCRLRLTLPQPVRKSIPHAREFSSSCLNPHPPESCLQLQLLWERMWGGFALPLLYTDRRCNQTHPPRSNASSWILVGPMWSLLLIPRGIPRLLLFFPLSNSPVPGSLLFSLAWFKDLCPLLPFLSDPRHTHSSKLMSKFPTQFPHQIKNCWFLARAFISLTFGHLKI